MAVDRNSYDQLFQAAVADFTHRAPCLGCTHVVRDGAGAILCAQHPQAGMLCDRCSARHVRRHDPVEERRCDRCDAVVEGIHPVVGGAALAGGPIRDPVGYHRPFVGRLILTGLGACRACHEQGGRPVVDLDLVVLASGWRP